MSTLLGINEILDIIPQRPPFLMIDRAEIDIENNTVTALKNVTVDEHYFTGHFPSGPILPGVLQLEAMSQASGLLLRKKTGIDKPTWLNQVQRIRFKRPVNPGDQLIIECSLEDISEEGCSVKSTAKVNGAVCSQASFTLSVLDTEILKPKSLLSEYPAALELTGETVKDVNAIADTIPHRFPFQFLDKVVYEVTDHIVGEKLVTMNEPICSSYMPGVHAFPNTFLMETAAQVGCAHMLGREENKGKLGIFMSIEKAVSNRPAVPGDRITLDVKMTFWKGSMGKCAAVIYSGEEILTEMTLAFAIVAKDAI